MKQPSPNWLEFSLRNVSVFTRKADFSKMSTGASRVSAFGSGSRQSNRLGTSESQANNVMGAGFDAFRSKLKSNLQGVKKQNKVQKEDSNYDGFLPYTSSKVVGSSIHHYTEDVRRLDLATTFM